MRAEDFERAGLWDPAAENAAERLAVLELLAARGATLEQMRAAARDGAFPFLASQLVSRPGVRLTLAEVAERLGVPVADVEAYHRAFGMPLGAAGEPAFTEEEARMFGAFTVGAGLLGPAVMRRFARVVGSSLTRIAEAAMALRLAQDRDKGELAAVETAIRASETLGALEEMLRVNLRLQLGAAAARLRGARASAAADTYRFSVGFVDLVGFTTLSRRMATRELEEIVERFEVTAHEVAHVRNGRVVKLIGDEVMFVAPEPATACDIALALVDEFAGDPLVTPRGGLADGELLVRAGDYHGLVVNLAARLAELAVPREVLVAEEVARGAGGAGFHFEPAGRRMLRGFGEPVAVLSVRRA